MTRSATIIILPIVPRVRFTDKLIVPTALSRKDYGRLCKRATEWKMTPSEAASELLALVLDPKRGIR